jgi:hypothetical protein
VKQPCMTGGRRNHLAVSNTSNPTWPSKTRSNGDHCKYRRIRVIYKNIASHTPSKWNGYGVAHWYLRLWYVVMNTAPGEFSRRKVTVAKRSSKSCQIDAVVMWYVSQPKNTTMQIAAGSQWMHKPPNDYPKTNNNCNPLNKVE